MPSYDQTPGSLGITLKRGDDFSALIDFTPIDMTGYTATSSIVSAVSGTQVVSFTTTIPDAAEGKVNIALTDAQTSALAAGTYKWSLTWTEGAATRTALVGFVEVI